MLLHRQILLNPGLLSSEAYQAYIQEYFCECITVLMFPIH